jgi:TatA/E family protein of Tat protein translocase
LGLSWAQVAGNGTGRLPRRPNLDTIGPWELLIVLAVGLLVGANGLPQMARSLGEGMREFRSALHESSQPGNPEARYRQPA